MTETIFTPQSMRTANIANTTIIGFARNIDDEDSLILRNIGARRTIIIPFSKYGEFALSPESIDVAARQYSSHLFKTSLTKTEVHHLMDFVLKNYDLVFNYKPEIEVAINKLIERDRLVVTIDGEKMIDAS